MNIIRERLGDDPGGYANVLRALYDILVFAQQHNGELRKITTDVIIQLIRDFDTEKDKTSD